MVAYEITRETDGAPTCWETVLGGQRWWIARVAEFSYTVETRLGVQYGNADVVTVRVCRSLAAAQKWLEQHWHKYVPVERCEISRLQDELELYKKANLLIASQRNNRDAEIEELTKIISEMEQHREDVKHEAYREFANMAVDRLTANYSSEYTHWIDDTIDQVLGELVGERE